MVKPVVVQAAWAFPPPGPLRGKSRSAANQSSPSATCRPISSRMKASCGRWMARRSTSSRPHARHRGRIRLRQKRYRPLHPAHRRTSRPHRAGPDHCCGGTTAACWTWCRRTRDSAGMRAIRGGEIGLVFQEPMSSLSAYHTVGNQLIEAIRLHSRLSKRAARERAIELLGMVGDSAPGAARGCLFASNSPAACVSA